MNVRKFCITKLVWMTLLLCVLFSSIGTISASAAELEKVDKPCFIINGTEKVYEGEDYYNEETGEYFYWGKGRGVDKTFSFKIRYSVESSGFTVNGKSVVVDASAHVTYDNDIVNYGSFEYHVYLNGLYSRKFVFNIEGTQTGTISGLKNGGTYRVMISTGAVLPDNYYLDGEGTITS